jgi:adenosylcobinamide kinase/adenosylcobinamide-phosphate guanylyltransferase
MSSGTRLLVTGPARSGKSEWAESLAIASGLAVTYLATSAFGGDDPEWQARLERHRQRRPPAWRTWEGPEALLTVLETADARQCLLVDSLGTWVAAYLEEPDQDWDLRCDRLLTALAACPATVILVAEETGWGIVPAYPLGRSFRDRLGHLTRRVARGAAHTYLCAAGFALDLARLGQPIAP